jgi:hypothetical protein
MDFNVMYIVYYTLYDVFMFVLIMRTTAKNKLFPLIYGCVYSIFIEQKITWGHKPSRHWL